MVGPRSPFPRAEERFEGGSQAEGAFGGVSAAMRLRSPFLGTEAFREAKKSS